MKNTFRVAFIGLITPLLISCGGGGSGSCSAVLGILPGASCSTPNTPPVANAGVTQNVTTGSLVTLDGSGSRDVNNQSLTYIWQMTAVPAGSLAALSSSTSAKPTFTADVTGNYIVSLVVNDGKTNSPSTVVNIYASVNNIAPSAIAGNNQSVSIGSVVNLDGTASSDQNRDSLTYRWSLATKPLGSSATLNSTISPNPKFTADVLGTYSAILIVNDGKEDSTASVVTITATNENKPPVADAGDAQYLSLKETKTIVTLDGTRSSDPDKDYINYQWVLITKPALSTAILVNDKTPKPSFIADVAGTYVASLIVNDGKLPSTAAAATVTVSAKNSDPVANAGVPQNVTLGLVTLDGTKSKDDDGDPLGFMWVMVSKPSTPIESKAVLQNATSPKPTFIADVVGTYVVTLIVSDGKIKSAPSPTTITVSTANLKPNASAGSSDRNEVLGTIKLDGSTSSDPDRDKLSYAWSLLAKPAKSSASLTTPKDVTTNFTADLEGIYVASLVVFDGTLYSDPVTVTIRASASNQAPNANAGDNQTAITGSFVTLDGSKSVDPNPGDTLTYKWAIVTKPSGSVASLDDVASSKPKFKADVSGVYLFSLVVKDDKGLESTVVTTTVTASSANVAPKAVSGTLQNVSTGSLVTLDGSGSTDDNGDTLTYSWTMLAKPILSNAALNDATSARPTFTVDQVGVYVASLVVSDGKLKSDPVVVTITASALNSAPVANAGSFQNVVTGQLVTLSGINSSDANGDPLSYKWLLVSRPLDSSATLANSTTAAPSFTADKNGTYVFSLQVKDGKVDSDIAYVTITAGAANVAPVANAGVAQTVARGATVTLDATNSSDANNDVLLYRWVLTYRPTNSTAVLSSATVARPTFVADQAGVYVATLVVNDGRLDSTQATIAITATP